MAYRTTRAGALNARPAVSAPQSAPTPDIVLVQAKAAARQTTLAAAEEYRRRYITDDDLATLPLLPRQSETSITQVKAWVINLRKDAQRRIGLVAAAPDQVALDRAINNDFSALGQPPYTVAQILAR